MLLCWHILLSVQLLNPLNKTVTENRANFEKNISSLKLANSARQKQVGIPSASVAANQM
jgi:hypothetical protein